MQELTNRRFGLGVAFNPSITQSALMGPTKISTKQFPLTAFLGKCAPPPRELFSNELPNHICIILLFHRYPCICYKKFIPSLFFSYNLYLVYYFIFFFLLRHCFIQPNYFQQSFHCNVPTKALSVHVTRLVCWAYIILFNQK